MKRLIAMNFHELESLNYYNNMMNRNRNRITDGQDMRLIELLRREGIPDRIIQEIRDRYERVWADMKRRVVQQHQDITVFDTIRDFAEFLKNEDKSDKPVNEYIGKAHSRIEGYRIQRYRDHIVFDTNYGIIYI